MSLSNDSGLAEALLSFRQSVTDNNLSSANLLLVHPYCIETFWLAQTREVQLSAVFLFSAEQSVIQVLGFVTNSLLPAKRNTSATQQDFYALARQYSAAVFDLQKAIPLHSVHIPKPWGQEIWYTGMEDRGVCKVSSNYPEMDQDSATVPLPWLLSMAPHFTHKAARLALLKILDPLPDPILGDLYFELHSEKREVYVVTHIDKKAWPNGKGGIRLGMNQKLRAQYPNDTEFRSAYLRAVQAYRTVRKRIDSEPCIVQSDEVQAEEQKLHSHMQSFTSVQSLQVGDTVVVQPDMPHSLLHGVRVIEFQSPVYERYIISFAQKVHTQKTWDSEQAIKRMRLTAPSPPVFERVECNELATVDRIVCFNEFNVWRVQLHAQGKTSFTPNIPYAICVGISGQTHVAGVDVLPEQACFVLEPACKLGIENKSNKTSTCLIAAPGL